MEPFTNLRESALGLVLGSQMREVLNVDVPYTGLPPNGPALAAALREAMLALKAAAIDETGFHIQYARLNTSAAYRTYVYELTPQLQVFDPATLTSREERLAFWINLYNALVIDGVIAYGVQRSVSERFTGLAFFRRAAYRIGGLRLSCDDIEHGILRANAGNPFLPGSQFVMSDRRLTYALTTPDPRIHFALNCASRSCPPIGVYSADRIDAQLDLALRSFVSADLELDEAAEQLLISRIFSWYRSDFGGREETIQWLVRALPEGDPRRVWLATHPNPRLAFKPYDWGLNV